HGWGVSNRPSVAFSAPAAPLPAPPAGVARRVARAAGRFLGRLNWAADTSPAGPVQPRETHSAFVEMAEDAYQYSISQQQASRQAAAPWEELLLLQRADGSFELAAPLDELLGRSLSELRRLAPALGPQGEEVVATLLALALMRKLAAGQLALWQGAERKARRWLDGVAGLDALTVEGLPAVEWAAR
ncbi:MAG: hypothetical protein HYU66_03675, partial [Armatimonadetes bacterium]|nr:hypothetical protein [Armatimonadota bacterium]